MFGFITKIFGTRSERALKKLWPYVDKINSAFEALRPLSHDALRQETVKLKQHIKEMLKDVEAQITTLQQEALRTSDFHQKEKLFTQIDILKKQYNMRLEEVLMEALPQAFAIAKETARRFKENSPIEVTATEYDRTLAASTDYVTLEGGKALWHNQWTAAGGKITWDAVHYDVQLIGGIILHQGKIAEMATGEGKTLVATLPAFLNALAGKGVHVITVNDYLARRDAAWMAPLYTFHGLSVACIDNTPPYTEARRQAYRADITYGTNNEFGFDYLRDNMASSPQELVQQNHHFAMIDEVDSVLIDDARTPLIISGPVVKSNEQDYYDLKPRMQKLYEAQKQLIAELLLEAKTKIKEGNIEEGGLALFRAYRGLPKSKPLIKYLSETGVRQILNKTEIYYLQDNSRLMPEADKPLFFTIDEKNNNIELTDKGIDYVTSEGEDTTFFVLPDIATEIAQIEHAPNTSDEEKVRKKEALTEDYAIKSQRIHVSTQLLKAYTLFERDVEYIVDNNRVKIVDEQTGRVLEGRRYSDGLHQAIEAKENVKIQKATQTYATITLQNYFRLYHKLAGMTGTAETEAHEFWQIYKLDVLVAPTHRPVIRDDRDDKVYKTMREKFNAIIEEIVSLTKQGRPVLVGTTSVEISELLSRMLSLRKVAHQVLNAKHHQKEAEVVAEAGKAGTVTIATNMAGRGTDIKLSPEAKSAGGLAIIGSERHESRRVDRQLRGRSGRQGDPGSSQFFVSLEDDLMRLFGSDRIARILDRLGLEEGEVIQHGMITRSIERSQKKVEENNFAHRKRLLEYDDVMNVQREVIYKRRRSALFEDRLDLDIMTMIYDTAERILDDAKREGNYDSFKLEVLGAFSAHTHISAEAFSKVDLKQLTEQLYDETSKAYQEKKANLIQTVLPILKNIQETHSLEEISIPISDGERTIQVTANLNQCVETEGIALLRAIEKQVTLLFIDQHWKEHLQAMDDLRQSVQNAVYEQKDPLLVYKFESFKLFSAFLHKVNKAITSYLFKATVPTPKPASIQEAHLETPIRPRNTLHESKEAIYDFSEEGGHEEGIIPILQPIRTAKVAGRNDRVTVQYPDGTIKRDVKFKNVEEDLAQNRCIIIEE